MHSGTIFRKDIIKSRYNTNKQCDYLRQLIILVVDGTFPDMITEIATNLYWTNAPVGVNAMPPAEAHRCK